MLADTGEPALVPGVPVTLTVQPLTVAAFGGARVAVASGLGATLMFIWTVLEVEDDDALPDALLTAVEVLETSGALTGGSGAR